MHTSPIVGELPLVSVIIPTYNRASFLEETIVSVVTQDYRPIEIIVLDDGSTDDSAAVLAKFGNRIVVEHHANMGETRTVNKGFGMARGRYACVVNSDDPILPGLIRAGVIALERHPEALAAYPDWREIGPRFETVKEIKMPDYSLHSMLRTFDVSIGPGVLIRRDALEIVGLRNPDLSYTGDLDFWFRLMLRGCMIHIPRVLATHRVHPTAASVTARDARMAEEVVRLAYSTLDDPNCPEDLRRERRPILAHAHFVARTYCGKNQEAQHRHYRAYLLMNPFNILRVIPFNILRVIPFNILREVRSVSMLIHRRVAPLWAIACFHAMRLFFFLAAKRSRRRASRPRRESAP